MKSFVKRFLSSAIAAAMLLTSAAFPTIASAAEVTYLYADLYGIDVVMSEAVGDPDTHTVEVTDSTGAPVDFTLMAMAKDETLATDVLSINFTTPINIGEVYTVTVDGTEKAFRVNKYSSVDFNNQAAGTNVVDKREIKDGNVSWMIKPWGGTTTEGQNDGVDMITDNADFGASSADKKLLLYNRDSGFALTNDMPTMDATIYADVTMYGVNSTSVGVNDFFLFGKGYMRHNAHNLTLSSSAVETKQAHAELSAVTDGLVNDDEHKYFDENGKYIKGSGGDPVYDYYATEWNGKIDMNLKNSNSAATSRTASYGAAASVAGKLNSITVDNTKETLAEQFVYELDKSVVPTTVRAAARVYDNNTEDEVSGYYGGFAGIAGEDSFNYTGTSLDETTRLYSNANNKKMGMSSNSTNLKVVDNVLITTCSVADSNVEAPAVTGYYADLYGVDVVYAEDPTEAIDALAINPVIKDEMGNVVPSSVQANATSKVVSVLADEMLELNTVYTISAGDIEKTFYVEKVFEENFNAQTAGNSYANNVSGSNNGITWMASGAPNAYGGAFITSDEKLGANNNDKKAVLYQRDALMRIENTLPNVTFYATTQTYDFVRTADAGQMLFTSGTGKTKGHLYKFSYNSQQIYLSNAEGTNADYTSKWDGVPEAGYTTNLVTTNGVISKTDTTIPADKNLDGEDDAWKADNNTTSDAADKVINFGTVTKAPEVKRAMRSYDFNTEDANPGYFGGFSALEGEKATYTGTGYNNKTGEIKEENCGLFVASASILVADDLMITKFVEVNPNREPAAVTKMYGDSYGLEIEFDKEPIALDYLGLQITDADGNEVELASTKVNGTSVRLTYAEMIDRDVKHTISFGNNRREFIVKTVFEENFDDITENVDPAALATITGDGWSATNAFVTDDEKWGASATNKMLGLNNAKGTFATDALTSSQSVTVSAKISYFMNGAVNLGSGGFWTQSIMCYGKSRYTLDDTYSVQNLRDGFEVFDANGRIYRNASLRDGNFSQTDTKTSVGLIGDGLSVAAYPYTTKKKVQVNWTDKKVEEVSPAVVENLTITKPKNIDNFALRIKDNSAITILSNTTDTYNGIPATVAADLAASGNAVLADAKLSYKNDSNVVTMLDDLLVTKFVDIDPDAKAPAVTGYYADLYGVDVVYAEDPTTAVETLLINPVIKDKEGNVVPSSVQANATSKVVSVLADEMLELNTVYTISAGDVEKTFYVKKLFEEDFEDFTATNAYDSGSSQTNDQGITWSWAGKSISTNEDGTLKSAAGAFVTDSMLGAKSADKHLVLRGDSKNLVINNTNPKVTFYATSKKYTNNNNNTNIGMFTRSSGAKQNSHFLQSSATTHELKIADYDCTGNANGVTTDSVVPSGNGTATGVATIVETVDGGVTLTEDTAASEIRLAMRSYDFDFGNGNDKANTDRGYYGAFVGYVGQDMTYSGTGFDAGDLKINDKSCTKDEHNSQWTKVGMHSYSKGLQVVDDVMITTVVEVDPDAKAPAVTNYYADLYGVDLIYEADPTEAVDALLINPVIKDAEGNVVPSTYSVNAENKIISVFADEMLDLEAKYTISAGDYTTSFTVVSIFEEDFNDLTASTDNVCTKTIKGEDQGIAWTLSGGKGGFITADAKFGASDANKKALLYGREAGVGISNTTANITLYATTQAYTLYGTGNSLLATKGGAKVVGHTFHNTASAQNLMVANYSLTNEKYHNNYNGVNVGKTSVANTLGVIDKATTTVVGDDNLDGTLNDGVTAIGAITFGDITTEPTVMRRAMRDYDFNTEDAEPGYLGGFTHNGDKFVYTGTVYDSDSELTATTCAVVNADPDGTVVVVDDVMITTCVSMEEAAINNIYADTFGMEIEFAEAPGYSQRKPVVENARGAKVELTTEYDADLGVIRATFAEPIKTDIAYKLSIGDSYVNKGLIVNKVFEENFDAITENVDPAALATITGEDWSATNAIVTADSKWGAKAADKKLLIHNGGNFAQTTTVEGKKATVSAKIENYYNGGTAEADSLNGSFWIQSEWLWFGKANGDSGNIKMKQYRDSNILSGADGKGFKYMDGKDFRPYYNIQSLTIPTTIDEKTGYYTKPTNTSLGLIGYGYGVSEYPYVKQQKMNLFAEDGTWEPVAIEGEFIDISADPVTSPRVVSNMAMRMTDNLTVFGEYTGDATPKYLASTVISDAQALTTTTNKFGYQAKNTVALLDDILVTTCTIQDEFVATGPVAINVTDIYGKADGVYVEFDEALEATDNFKDIEVYEDGDRVDTTATVNGNVVKLAVDGDIKSGAIYRVVVPAEFQPNEDLIVKTESAKNFKLTIYANEDFEDEVGTEAVAFVDTDNTVAEVINGELVLRGNEFTLPKVKDATNYNVSFDAKVYSVEVTEASQEPEEPIIYGTRVAPQDLRMWYNGGEDKANGYEWEIGNTSLTKNVYKESLAPTQYGDAISYAPIQYGDALYENGRFIKYEAGSDLTDHQEYLQTVDEEPIEESLFTAAEYTVSVEKVGKKATYSLNGAVVSSFEGTENEDGASKGIFGVSASNEEFVVIDNIYAYSYEEIKDIAIELTEDGKVKVNNVSSTEKPVVIVVATYDSNNAMIDAWVADGVNSLAGFGEYNESYTVDTTGAVKTKAFVWDSMTSLIPYCTPAQK